MYIYTVTGHLQDHDAYLDNFTKTNIENFWIKIYIIKYYILEYYLWADLVAVENGVRWSQHFSFYTVQTCPVFLSSLWLKMPNKKTNYQTVSLIED